jgi:hypothetical protein
MMWSLVRSLLFLRNICYWELGDLPPEVEEKEEETEYVLHRLLLAVVEANSELIGIFCPNWGATAKRFPQDF